MAPKGKGKRKASLKDIKEAPSEAIAADVTDNATTAAVPAAAAADPDESSAAVSAKQAKGKTKTTKNKKANTTAVKKKTTSGKKKTTAVKRKPAKSSSIAADVTDNATAAASAAHQDESSAASEKKTKGKAKPTKKTTTTTAGTKKTATGKRKSEDSAPVEEKRAKLYRATCPVALEDRILRASTQRLYLVHREEVDPETSKSCKLTVLGSTGNCYDVTLAEVPTCSCPDYLRKRDLCKHILFVTLKVVGLPRKDPLVFQKAYLLSELRNIFTMLNSRRVGGTVLANETVRQNYEKLKNSKSEKGKDGEEKEEEPAEGKVKRRSLDGGDECESDCPICFDSLLDCPLEQLTYCRAACGVNFHADCIRRWTSTSMHGRNPTCPNCRQPWEDKNSSKGRKKGSSGFPSDSYYLNLGRLQGQSATRDTSTYYSPGTRR